MVEFDNEANANHLKNIQGVSRVKKHKENTWAFEVENDKVRNNIFQYAMENDLVVLTMQKESQNLEAIFKKLTT